ncbi:MAG: hypothetical protein ACKOZX_15655 [Gammaproteobacteria bacterium]
MPFMRLRPVLCLSLILSCASTAHAWDDTRNITAASARCAAGITCAAEVSPGFMSGQVYLNFSARAPGLSGAGFSLRVINAEGAVVTESSGGAMSDGSITALIANGQNLAPGRYHFVIDAGTEGVTQGVAEGGFTVTTGAGDTSGDDAATAPPAAGPSADPSEQANAADSPVDVTGRWYGIASTVGTIDMTANGRYQHNGSTGGRYRVEGDKVHFDGTLAAWNSGTATLRDGVLEFYWTQPDGSQNWFVFQR